MNKLNITDKLDRIIDRMSFCKENLYEIDGMEYRGLRTAFEDEFEMKKGKTLDELISAWGQPTDYSEAYPATYCYKESPDSDESVEFHIDLNTNTIDYIAVYYHKM